MIGRLGQLNTSLTALSLHGDGQPPRPPPRAACTCPPSSSAQPSIASRIVRHAGNPALGDLGIQALPTIGETVILLTLSLRRY